MNESEANLQSCTEIEEVIIEVTAIDKEKYKRLDLYLVDKLPSLSRSFIKFLFESGQILVLNPTPHTKLELKRIPPVGSKLSISVPPPPPSNAIAQNIPLEVLFEDEYLIVINKPAGLVVHPGAGNPDGTLVNALLYHCLNQGTDLKNNFSGVSDRFRPGIVHRLDKGTSGVMVAAKAQKCHEELVKLFSVHNIDRAYQAIAMGGEISRAGVIESVLGRHPTNRLKMAANAKDGRRAVTHYKVIEEFKKCFHIELKLETGRTHQIRVHLTDILRTPILNDHLYSNPSENKKRLGEEISQIINDYPHPFLHAKLLGFVHPMTGKTLKFEVPPPQIFEKVLQALRGN